MRPRRFWKKIRNTVLGWIFRVCLWSAAFVPIIFLRWISRFFIFGLLYQTNSRLARNGRRTVRIAYGDKLGRDQQEILLRQSFAQLAEVVAEVVYYFANSQQICQRVRIEGRHYLDQAIAQDKGVVAVSAHFGNFPLMIFWFAMQGYPVNVIMRRPRDPKVAKDVLDITRSSGVNIIYTIPTRPCIQRALKALRKKEILFILLDQNYGADARVHVNFFGRDSAVGASPVVFAQRAEAVIMPMFCVRQPDHSHCIYIEPEIPVGRGLTDKDHVTRHIQEIICVIEKYIRAYPPLWAWMHNRWKDVKK